MTSGAESISLPPGMRIPRLEQILGYPLTSLSWERLVELGTRHLPEDQSLDFKSTLYAPVESLGKQSSDDWAQAKVAKGLEPAKDVAGFANAGGGMILLGISEDDQARALPPDDGVSLAENEREKIRSVIMSRVRPWVTFEVVALPNPAKPERGVIAIIVPASDSAPHLVNYGTLKDPAHRVPVRVGVDTHYLGEHQIASLYRNRFVSDRAVVDRLSTLADEGHLSLDISDRGWLAITVTPTRMAGSRRTLQESRDWLSTQRAAQRQLALPSVQHARVGRGRIVHTSDYSGVSRPGHIELRHDGSAFMADSILYSPAQVRATSIPEAEQTPNLATTSLMVQESTLAMLRASSAHAVETGAGGDLLVRAELVSAGGLSIELWKYSWPRGTRKADGSLPLDKPQPYETTCSLSISQDPADLVAAAAEISREIVDEFGVADALMLRHDGTVDPKGLGSKDGYGQGPIPLIQWATENGLINEAPSQQTA